MIKEKKIFYIATFFILFLVNNAFADVKSSDLFNKALKKIAHEQVKKDVIHWVEEQDSISGIVARDLIGQLLDGKDKDQLIKTAIDVAGTMIFLNEFRTQLDALAEQDQSTNNILEQAKALGWDKEKLYAYTGIFLYYIKRHKEHLYVSPYIEQFTNDIKDNIKSLKLSNRPWHIKSYEIIASESIHAKNIIYDVRTYELFSCFLSNKILGTSISIDMKDKLITDYIKDMKLVSINEWATLITKSYASLDDITPLVVNPVLANYRKNIELFIDSKNSNPSFNLLMLKQLVQPLATYFDTSSSFISDQAKTEDIIKKSLNTLLQDWLKKYNDNMLRLDYSIMMGISWFSTDARIDATVVDQIKWGYFGSQNKFYGLDSCYVWAGGLLDPIYRNIVGDNKKLHLFGIGGTQDNFVYTLTVGVPNGDFNSQKTYGVSIGYIITLEDLQ